MANPSVLLGKKFNGYLRARIPSALDDIAESVVSGFAGASAEGRRAILERVTPVSAAVLCAYAERMAAVAVRGTSVEPVRRGLLAVGMAAGRLEDDRDGLYPMAALCHASTVIGSSPEKDAESVAGLLPPPANAVISRFLKRSERDKSLAAMGLRAAGEGADFRYVSGPAWG